MAYYCVNLKPHRDAMISLQETFLLKIVMNRENNEKIVTVKQSEKWETQHEA